ncbi:MAG: hypothetical protein WCK98_04465 [bacterium]
MDNSNHIENEAVEVNGVVEDKHLDHKDDRSDAVLEKQRTNFYTISLVTGEGKKDLTANILLDLDNVSTLRPDQAEAIVQAIHSVDPVEDWTKVFNLEGVSETDLDIIQKYLLESGVQFVCREGEAMVGLEPILKPKIEKDLKALGIACLDNQLDVVIDTLFGGVQTYNDELSFTIPLEGATRAQQQSVLTYFRKAGLFTEIYIVNEDEIDLFINLNP